MKCLKFAKEMNFGGCKIQKSLVLGGRVDGWMGGRGWVGGKAVLRIAYSNQKPFGFIIFDIKLA